MEIRAAFTVYGTVQGVFFRKFTRDRATEYGLVGWVKNKSDGTVVGEVQGPEEKVKQLLEDLDRGPQSAKVTRVDHKPMNVTEGTDIDFEIRRESSSAYR